MQAHIPDRFLEGYGLTRGAIDRMRALGVSLLFSVDCGITAVDEVGYANELGLDVVILDHHTVPEVLPDAVAWVDPKAPGSPYPFTELTSVGVVYKLLVALAESLRRPFDEAAALDLVALGTVADVAPLVGENRHLVKRGLQTLADTRRPGLRALLDVAGVHNRELTTDVLSYALAPRINAAGRVADGRTAFELLTTDDELKARQLAATLDEMNGVRQRQTVAAMELAYELLAREPMETPLQFLWHERLPQGIVGLVAGRLAEEFYRPAIICEANDE